MIHLYKVPDFKEHKKNLIRLINQIPKNPFIMDNDGGRLSHTDWNLPKELKRDYLDYFLNNIFKEYAENFCSKIKCNEFKIKTAWFQVYEKGDNHVEHTHGSCHFTNVFYLQLPKNLKTNIIDLFNKKINIDIQEGDIVTFPSFYFHSSPKNDTNDKKVIISFNCDIL